ncbi:MAG: right-handed parallel beta-helix repeat-containing protein [Verrucomicrobia bacterium]|nr:right-handed parallel beta-helix repeat-containing protein [Verrucomicrobiota bacterium]MDA1087250.1 right-handed parallel beta-helix repeat-containing protein [Verrucomicrobiota bacterium]
MNARVLTLILIANVVAAPFSRAATDDYMQGLDECQSPAIIPPTPPTATVIVVGAESPTPPAPAPTAVFFQRANSGAAEHDGTVQVPVRIRSSLDVPLDVNYEIQDVTATLGNDHSTTNGTITFEPGQIRAFIPVILLDDADIEGTNEQFRILLTGVSSIALAVISTRSTHDFYVVENDHTPLAYYVDITNGSDTLHSGQVVTQAFRTIQHAADMALAGDTIYIHGGEYREEIDLKGIGGYARSNLTNWVTLCAYSNEVPVIKGSDVVTDWLPFAGAIWQATNGLAHVPQAVFVNDHPLDMLGWPNATFESFPGRYKNPKRYCAGPADMTPGSFYFDGTNTLFVWLDDSSSPTQSLVEVSQRSAVITRGISHLRFRNLSIRHNNSVSFTPQGQAAVVLARSSLIEDCDIQWCDFSGLDLDSNSRASRCTLSNNGSTGAGWNQTTNVFVSDCSIISNNWRRFNKDWHSGGIKTVPDAGGTVEGCEVAYNGSGGIWFDACDSGAPIVIRNNYIHHNRGFSSAINPSNGTGVGIIIEISTDADIYNNILVSNYNSAVRIHTSSRCRIFNNTMAWTPITDSPQSTVLNLFQEPGDGGLPRFPYNFRDIEVFNNVIYEGAASFAISLNTYDTNFVSNIQIDHNLHYKTSSPFRFGHEGTSHTDLSAWNAATGLSGSSLATNPEFSVASSNQYLPSATSPLLDAGTNLATVITDYVGTPRPQGAGYDIGAYERP